METTKYVRRPLYVDVILVTEENIEEVAVWCRGELRVEEPRTEGDTNEKTFIKVNVHRALNERQTKAYVGDYILFAGAGFKVYTPRAFEKNFELANSEKPETPQFAFEPGIDGAITKIEDNHIIDPENYGVNVGSPSEAFEKVGATVSDLVHPEIPVGLGTTELELATDEDPDANMPTLLVERGVSVTELATDEQPVELLELDDGTTIEVVN